MQKKRIASHFRIKKKIKDKNKNIFKINFFLLRNNKI